MPKFVMHHNRNYTVMANFHLRDKTLSNKSRGLLSTMLSLPDTWDYTVRGLSAICKDGVSSIGGQLKELEEHGYLVRRKIRDAHGRITDVEYDVYEQPRASTVPMPEKPDTDLPHTENQDMVNQYEDCPELENQPQLNTYPNNKRKNQNTDFRNYPSINLDGTDGMEARCEYEELIKENLDYDILLINRKNDRSRLEEIIQIMLDTVCSTNPTLRINGERMPQSVVKSRLLKLNSMHIEYVLDSMRDSPSDIRNIRTYLLTALYNASLTIDNYYAAKVNHDFCRSP